MINSRILLRGSALISTLLSIVVLAIIVTAFLQSMTVERQTAHSYLNRTKATLAAEAGLSRVMDRLERSFSTSQENFVVSTENPGQQSERLRILELDPPTPPPR